MQAFITVLLAAALVEGQAGGVVLVGEDNGRVDRWKKELSDNWSLGELPDFYARLQMRDQEREAYKQSVIALKKEDAVGKGRIDPRVIVDLQRRMETAEARMAKIKQVLDLQDLWIVAKKLEARQRQQTITTESEAFTAHQITVCRSLFEFALVMAIKSGK
jgi:hypothetical protein